MQDQAELDELNGKDLRCLASEHDSPSQTQVERPGGRFAAMRQECILAHSKVHNALKHQWELQEKLVDYLLEEKGQKQPKCNGHSLVPQKALSKVKDAHVSLDQELERQVTASSATSGGVSQNTEDQFPSVHAPAESYNCLSQQHSASDLAIKPKDAVSHPKIRRSFSENFTVPSLNTRRSVTSIFSTASRMSAAPRKSASPRKSTSSRASRRSDSSDMGRRRGARMKEGIRLTETKDFNLVDTGKTTRKCIVEELMEKKKGPPELPANWQERFFVKVEHWSVQWSELIEPDRTGCLADFVLSSKFSCIFAFVIFLDAVVAAYATNYGMANATSETTNFTKVMEFFALVFYITEFVCKLCVHRFYYFANEDWLWNIFDMVLVFQATFDALLTYLAFGDAGNITFMKLLRLLKLAKILRLFRAVRMLTELRIIFASITNSFMGLFWTFVTLALILYIFSLMFVQGLTGYLIDHSDDSNNERTDDIRLYFGSVQLAALTLYKCTSGGVNWHDIFIIVSEAGPITTMQFIFFIGFFNFALLNILTGIFMEKALQAAQPERDQQLLEQRRAEEKEVYGLMQIFKRMDLDGSGTLTHEEYLDGARDKNVQIYLKSLGLNTESAEMFFRVLEQMTGSGEVPVADFVEGCGKMKGYATAMDMQILTYQLKSLKEIMMVHIQKMSDPEPDADEAEQPESSSALLT